MATKLKPILKMPNRNLSFNPSKNRNNRRQQEISDMKEKGTNAGG